MSNATVRLPCRKDRGQPSLRVGLKLNTASKSPIENQLVEVARVCNASGGQPSPTSEVQRSSQQTASEATQDSRAASCDVRIGSWPSSSGTQSCGLHQRQADRCSRTSPDESARTHSNAQRWQPAGLRVPAAPWIAALGYSRTAPRNRPSVRRACCRCVLRLSSLKDMKVTEVMLSPAPYGMAAISRVREERMPFMSIMPFTPIPTSIERFRIAVSCYAS
jgi:hypothetical protein